MRSTFPLPEGDVVVEMPHNISAESYAEVEVLFGLILRALRRGVECEKRAAILNAQAVCGDGSCDPGFGVDVDKGGVIPAFEASREKANEHFSEKLESVDGGSGSPIGDVCFRCGGSVPSSGPCKKGPNLDVCRVAPLPNND